MSSVEDVFVVHMERQNLDLGIDGATSPCPFGIRSHSGLPPHALFDIRSVLIRSCPNQVEQRTTPPHAICILDPSPQNQTGYVPLHERAEAEWWGSSSYSNLVNLEGHSTSPDRHDVDVLSIDLVM
jgi:hypothetical protein